VQPGTVRENDGAAVEAFKNLGELSHLDFDCHGMTFANKELWINNDQVEKILKGEGYEKTDAPAASNVGIYRDSTGAVKHSVTVSSVKGGKIQVTGKGVVTISLVTTPAKPGPDRGWQDEKATIEYYKEK
jgi:hypothetical protein